MFGVAIVFLLANAVPGAEELEISARSSARAIRAVTIQGSHRHVDLTTQVGQPYNARAIDQDVRALWSTGRFDDVRVEARLDGTGTAVVFRVTESPELRLRKFVVEPATYGLHLPLAEGMPLTRRRAQAVTLEARRLLNTQGYRNAQVDYELTPVEDGKVDLRLTVKPGEHLRLKEIQFTGDLRLPSETLRHSLRALETRRVFGWPLHPTYTADAVESDLARIRSVYLSKGYFDASVRVDETEIQGKDARLTVRVNPGPLSALAPDAMPSCRCLLAARRAAERQGVLDFSATLHVQPTGDGIDDVSLDIQRGPVYHVGRITFVGNHHFSDATLRRNLLLDEGELFDERLLRQSLARINRTALFETITENNVAVHTDPVMGIADLTVQVTEHKRGAWRLSGPVGPPSFAGPLQASISARLPPWGRGLLELSTYTASISMFAFAHPLLPLLAIGSKRSLLPVLALQRPFSPGEGWKSGFSFAPQLGWRALGLGYGVTQTQQRLLSLLSGDRGLVPRLSITVDGPSGDGTILCDPAPPRFLQLRTAAGIALRFAGALTAF
jgi:hypothetical protein